MGFFLKKPEQLHRAGGVQGELAVKADVILGHRSEKLIAQ